MQLDRYVTIRYRSIMIPQVASLLTADMCKAPNMRRIGAPPAVARTAMLGGLGRNDAVTITVFTQRRQICV